jgi:hypothetical protein
MTKEQESGEVYDSCSPAILRPYDLATAEL